MGSCWDKGWWCAEVKIMFVEINEKEEFLLT